MTTVDLNSATFWDKVFACWLGKNAGGTLGTPLERAWGEPEPFDIWWYPKLQEGGMPNDDLEMQLVWLKALEEVGPKLKAADLAQYWLDYIGYNWDEYGLNKTNLRLGLRPPVSGAYNNWFKDCMGCPIRSEIWACIAPGVPSLAVRYAYEDAIVDHAGGESVYGEFFNTAMESAAFVISDREQLLDIGRSYVPDDSFTAKAIDAARVAYKAGLDWKAARQRVLAAAPSLVAQYSPINMGFQVIGWLWGEDFGDALCKAVNCGYDTDCTGATLGSILGILIGRQGLPQKWIEPLGEGISTNESWGGLRHVSSVSNPIPKTLTELTNRVIAEAKRVLSAHNLLGDNGLIAIDPAKLYADDSVRALWKADPMRLAFPYDTMTVEVDYRDTPAVIPGSRKVFVTHLGNPHPDPLAVHCALRSPEGWQVEKQTCEVTLPPKSTASVEWEVTAPPAGKLENSNRLDLSLHIHSYPAVPATPIVLIGAQKYRYAGPFSAEGLSDKALFDRVLPPEAAQGDVLAPQGRPGEWNEISALDNGLPLGKVFTQAGVLYIQAFLHSLKAEEVWIGTSVTCPAKLWVNGQLLTQAFRYRPARPNYDGDRESYAVAQLGQGWNEVLIKCVQAEDSRPFECFLMVSGAHNLHSGLPDLGRTRLPWD